MSSRYKFHNQNNLYFITPTVIRWVDTFTRDNYRNIFVENVNYCIEHKGLNVHAWVLMTNHAHLIVSTRGPRMEHIMRDLKKFTSKAITKKIEENGHESRDWMMKIFLFQGRINSNNERVQFWQNGDHPIELWNSVMIRQKIKYIHQNPVRAGFVAQPEDWRHSSIHAYMKNECLIKTDPIMDLMFDS